VTYPRRAATIFPSIATIESAQGPGVEHYAIPLDLPEVFRWVPGSAETVDHINVLEHTGGTPGTWIRQRRPDKGADLAAGNATIYVSGNRYRVLPASTLTGNAQLTLGTTGAVNGDWIEVVRLDVGAYTYAIVNGGPGAGTLCTMPVSQRARFVGYFDGTNWLHRASHLML